MDAFTIALDDRNVLAVHATMIKIRFISECHEKKKKKTVARKLEEIDQI